MHIKYLLEVVVGHCCVGVWNCFGGARQEVEMVLRGGGSAVAAASRVRQSTAKRSTTHQSLDIFVFLWINHGAHCVDVASGTSPSSQ